MTPLTPMAPRQRSGTAPWLLGALLTLGLTACGGGGSAPNPGSGTPGPSQPGNVRVSGEVQLPAGALSVMAAETAETADWDAPHVPDQLLVTSGGLSAQSLSPQLAGLRTESLSELGLVRVWTPQPQELAQQLAESGIASQPEYLYQVQATTPNDPGFPGNAGIDVGGIQHQDYLTQIGAASAWRQLQGQGKSPAGVLTAVLDTGADRSHPDLSSRLRGGYDFCSTVIGGGCSGTDSDYSDILTEPRGHGTAMAGLIGAATNNGRGLSGMTWSGPLLAVKVLGDQQGGNAAFATTSSLAAGLGYAVKQGARVVNMSLGIPGLKSDPAVRQQIERAAQADIVMISAAGNTPGDGLYFPANQPEVIAVGAVNPAGQMSCFSARPKDGQKLDLLAPGGESGCGRGTSTMLELDRLELDRSGGYKLSAGTSEASALTSGAASLIRAAYPGLKAAQVRQALLEGGKPSADTAQPQLNLPGALAAAQRLSGTPAPQPNRYTLIVQAYQNGRAVGAPFKQTAETLKTLKLPYTLNLPRGRYDLRAEVDTSKASYQGQTTVDAQGDTTQNIAVR
ncbi:S8 family peptidase [Deinococcus sp. Marseille-Q6407]|uniref:S8 family peptidase n=1 Tax=Deinococcus sp. Marseille-Q6407 TaxID=2969223 RepID=UPI0021C1CB3D|nr:S8 family serine peptidase [Deinococcus sp. Marseille-Q6407]